MKKTKAIKAKKTKWNEKAFHESARKSLSIELSDLIKDTIHEALHIMNEHCCDEAAKDFNRVLMDLEMALASTVTPFDKEV